MANIIRLGGGGGSQPTLITKSITQNGIYNASSDSADGYSSVNVNVAGGGGSTNYSGTTNPTSSLGIDGDTYTKYTTYSYQRLNYVETNGGVSSQYVDTGRQFTPNSVAKISAYLYSTAYASWQCIFGWRHSNPTLCIYTRANGNNLIRREQNGQTDVDITGIYDADVDIEVSATGMSITDGVDTYSGSYTFSDTTAGSMRLLSSGYGGSNEQGKYKLYEFIWEENGVEVIHYVPILDDYNTPCLLDITNGEIKYSNNSSYPLVSGGSAGTTVDGVRVVQTYLKINGEWEVVDNIKPIININ